MASENIAELPVIIHAANLVIATRELPISAAMITLNVAEFCDKDGYPIFENSRLI